MGAASWLGAALRSCLCATHGDVEEVSRADGRGSDHVASGATNLRLSEPWNTRLSASTCLGQGRLTNGSPGSHKLQLVQGAVTASTRGSSTQAADGRRAGLDQEGSALVCISALPDQDPSSPPKATDLVARSASQLQSPGKPEHSGEIEAANPGSSCPSDDEGTFDMLGTSSDTRRRPRRYMQRGRGDSSPWAHGTGASCRKQLWHSQSEAAGKVLPREGLRLSWAEHTQVRGVTQHG